MRTPSFVPNVASMGARSSVSRVRRHRLLRVPQTDTEYRLEVTRGLLVVSGFVLSIPLAFVLVSWTPVIWIALLPLDRLLVAPARRARDLTLNQAVAVKRSS